MRVARRAGSRAGVAMMHERETGRHDALHNVGAWAPQLRYEEALYK